MLFSKFKKPKWQHRNAEVRKQALLALDPKDSDFDNIITELINDNEIEIRKLAIKRLNNIDKLETVIGNETNIDAKKLAKERMIQMISGIIDCGLTHENRIDRANSFEDITDIETILKKTDDSKIKMALLPRITRLSILESLVIDNSNLDLQLAALEKITEQAALERIIKKCRTKNKRVTKTAKEKLETIIAELEKPKEIEKARKAICLSLETLEQQGYNKKFNSELQRLTQQWNEIDYEQDTELEQKYQTANQSCQHILQKHKEIEEKRQVELKQQEQFREEKQKILAKLKENLQKLQTEASAAEDFQKDSNKILSDSETAWKLIGQLPTKEEDKLCNEFYSIRKQTIRLTDGLTKALETKDESLELIKRIDTFMEENFIPAGKFKEIQRKGKAFQIDPLWAKPPQHLQDVNNKLEALKKKFDLQEKNLESQRKELPSILNSLEKELDAGSVSDANNLLKKARKLINNIPSIDGKTKNRFNALSARVSQLQDWKGWATTPKKEELCKEMEALAESSADTDPEQLAENIKLLQEQWKKLGASEPNSSQELWERFSGAADKAFAPCKTFYEQQSQLRQINQQQREGVCRDMEQFFADTDWGNPDWKKVDSFLSSKIDAWKKCGPTDRKITRTITDRYRTAQDAIKTKLNDYRNDNKAKKLEIIEQAQEILNIEDVFQAADRIKMLQKDWKEVGATFRKDEQKIWSDFRTVCDQVFSKRQEIYDANNSERNENLHKKNQVTEQIEQIASASDEEFATSKHDLEELKQQWKEITNIPKSADKECYERFKKACQTVIDKEKSIKDAALKQKDDAFQQKLDICLKIESALLDTKEINNEEYESDWQQATATHKQQDNILNKRFRENLTLATTLDKEKLAAISEQNTKAAELLCIKAEIAAGIETPAEYSSQRREYQVNNLADGMKNSTPDPKAEVNALNNELLALNLIPAEKTKGFGNRMDKAKS
ncbi:MAG: DUF349 domain-containing protein [Gammaproteobacteria bacterium]|nr:MAG: DUF349 domain-containing protein [Gammaproteobacteria bacterium]